MKQKRLLVLLLALSQPIVAYLTTLGDGGYLMDQSRSPLITPATYAFSIWGVICLGSVVYGIYQVLPRAKSKLYDAIALPAAGVFAGFSIWLYVAQMEWLLTTIVVFLGINYCLWQVYSKIIDEYFAGKMNLFEKIFVYGTFGLYFGWGSIAVFANVASAVKFYGVPDTNPEGLAWQGIVLMLAAASSLYWIKRIHQSWVYAGTVLWAFIAILLGTIQRGEIAMPLTIMTALAIAVITTYTLTGSKGNFES